MDYHKRFAVKPGTVVDLASHDPGFTGDHDSEEAAKAETDRHRQSLTRLQRLLYAGDEHSLLVVLQGPDAAGKDGTINHVLSALNPQGTRVVGFRQPTPEELAHDFLWRVHPHTPRRGEIVVFNRSHYEDVLVTRVHKQIAKPVWKRRYRDIRAFEALLAAQGTLILKFFLHIDENEQLARFASRLADPEANWKISEADYDERPHWRRYVRAFEEAIAATSTREAPWFVIPSNHKWFRNLAVSQIIASALDGLGMHYPPPRVDLAEIRRRFHAAKAAQGGRRGHLG